MHLGPLFLQLHHSLSIKLLLNHPKHAWTMHACSPLIPTNSHSLHSPNSYHIHHLQLHSSSNPPSPLLSLLLPLISPLKHHPNLVPKLPIFTNYSPFASPSIHNHPIIAHTTHTTTTQPTRSSPVPKKKTIPTSFNLSPTLEPLFSA